MRGVALGITLLLLSAVRCEREPVDEQVQLGQPLKSPGVRMAERLVDGRRALEGAPWNSSSAATFRPHGSYVLFDLGETTPIDAAYLQGDDNDEFLLEISEDGTRFSRLWTVPASTGGGLRARWTTDLSARGRYIRLRAIGGDRWVSVSELQLFSIAPSTWPPRIPAEIRLEPRHWSALGLVLFAAVALGSTFVRRRGPRWTRALAYAITICAAFATWAVALAWPVDASVINLSRAVAALVAGAVVLRLGFHPDERSRLWTALLAAMAMVSVLTFYNLGHPQFRDARDGEPTYVHAWDLRVYFPVVKYFDELGYDGVYLASVKAYASARLDDSLDSIKDVRLRDLRDYEMRRVDELSDEIHAVQARFSPARWSEFQRDMAYFWETMGPEAYLDSLRDHGGNATPAWLWTASALWGSAAAKESTFSWTALLDPLLLGVFFVVAWRTFGLRAALVCMVAFGATTVYQFGSNWGGSTLRTDWMVLIGLGVCALKSERWVVAGMLLGWAAMIRAFPAVAIAFIAVPVGWRWVLARGGLRTEAESRGSGAGWIALLKVGAGVALVVVALGVVSTSAFGWERSWGAWSQRMSIHANRPNVNHLGLTALVSYDPDNLWHNLRARGVDPERWGPLTARTMQERRWLIALGMLAYTLAAVLACRGSRLSDAAVIGTMMIPIYFYPSNYYLHILFLWPLLLAAQGDGERDEVRWSLVAATVLFACAIQWFGWLIRGSYGQFLFWSGVILVAVALLLAIPIAGAGLRPHRHP